MTDEQPPSRPVSHRAPVSRGESLRRLWPPVAAVTVVIVVIVLLLALNGRSTPSVGPALQSPSPVVSEQAPATPPPSTHPVTPSPTHHATPSPTPRPTTPAEAPVDVLNNSTISGLAHEVAREVAAKGWPIDVIGNFEGRIAESTIYYDAGQRQLALVLAHAMPQIQRVLPRFEGLPGTGLTLVVTRDWPH
jgi:LytR cell envelope-related transcriptional attenuator